MYYIQLYITNCPWIKGSDLGYDFSQVDYNPSAGLMFIKINNPSFSHIGTIYVNDPGWENIKL